MEEGNGKSNEKLFVHGRSHRKVTAIFMETFVSPLCPSSLPWQSPLPSPHSPICTHHPATSLIRRRAPVLFAQLHTCSTTEGKQQATVHVTAHQS